jgi:WD40 repeat protein
MRHAGSNRGVEVLPESCSRHSSSARFDCVRTWHTVVGSIRISCGYRAEASKELQRLTAPPPVVCPRPLCSPGCRRGSINVFDLRLPTAPSSSYVSRALVLHPMASFNVVAPAAATPTGRRSTAASTAPTTAPGLPGHMPKGPRGRVAPAQRSVTSLLFLPHDWHSLVSSSDKDGTVKVWDLRNTQAPTQDITLPPAAAAAAAAAGVLSGGVRGGRRAAGGAGGRGSGGSSSLPMCGEPWLSFSCSDGLSSSSRVTGITSMALSPAGGWRSLWWWW